MAINHHKLGIVVLISGRGSNLQAIIDAEQQQQLPVDIRAVISDRENIHGLTIAEQAGIETVVVSPASDMSREAYDQQLLAKIDQYSPDLIVLAGFMRILSESFVNHYSGRMINIHPSLLPKFRGLNTHQRALDAKETWHGATVHFVSPELDGGPRIAQVRVPVDQNDTADTLALRVLEQEHLLYPLVIRWIAESRLRYHDKQVYLDDQLVPEPIQIPIGT